jgi:hypothetical protein
MKRVSSDFGFRHGERKDLKVRFLNDDGGRVGGQQISPPLPYRAPAEHFSTTADGRERPPDYARFAQQDLACHVIQCVDTQHCASILSGDELCGGPDVKNVLHCLTGMCVLAALWMAAPATALADSISTFAASGTFGDGSTLAGTITIDVTTGIVTGSDIIVESTSSDVTSFGSVNRSSVDPFDSDSWVLDLETGSGAFPYVDLYVDTAALGSSTLIGYSGGALYSDALRGSDGANTVYRPTPGSDADYLESGSLSLVPSIPEPATLDLLAVSVACLGGVAASRGKRCPSV